VSYIADTERNLGTDVYIVLFQKAGGVKVKLNEAKLQEIQDRYFSIYEREIDDTEWNEINESIQRHFREYDALVNPGAKGSAAPVKSVRRALPTPFVPGISSDRSEPSSSSVIQTNGRVASDRSSLDRR